MRCSKNALFGVALGMAAAGLAGCGGGGQAGTASADPVARGKYLVTQVQMCGDCHTPRLKTGELDAAHALQGAPLAFQPAQPVPVWAPIAPPIAGGYMNWTDEQLATFLQTGRTPEARYAKPPMPAFRLDEADAKAVVAYLRSLK